MTKKDLSQPLPRFIFNNQPYDKGILHASVADGYRSTSSQFHIFNGWILLYNWKWWDFKNTPSAHYTKFKILLSNWRRASHTVGIWGPNCALLIAQMISGPSSPAFLDMSGLSPAKKKMAQPSS